MDGFQRFLVWVLVPVVFGVVLLLILLTLFGFNIKSQALEIAGKIPVVNSLVPDAKGKDGKPANDPAETAKQQEKQVTALQNKITAQQEELKKADALYQQRDQAYKDLQEKNNQLEEQMKFSAQADDAYQKEIQATSSMFAKMTPSKSAPILEVMTTKEQVLILSEMKPDSRVKILEKMDPKKAAEVSLLLKDQVPSKDLQIAALQEQLKSAEAAGTKAAPKLTATDIGNTFAGMTPKSAADVLVELYKASPTKAIDILSAVDTQARSKILSAMAEGSKETAVEISSKLVP